MGEDALKSEAEPARLPTPADILDAVAKGRSAADTLREFLGKEPEHFDNDVLGGLSPPHTPSRGR